MARQSRNSRDSAPLTAVSASVVASSAAVTNSNAGSSYTGVGNVALSPEILSAVAQAVRAALAAEKESVSAAASVWPTPSVGSSVVSITAPAASLDSRASVLLASGAGFVAPQSLASSGQQGRSSIVVPSFVSTFSPPISVASAPASANPIHVPSVPDARIPNVPAMPTLDQPFVVGPGFSPIPGKLVSQITSGKYVDLNDLLAANLMQSEPEPQLLFDGRVVLTYRAKKQRRRLDDIVSWVEAFTVYCLVLTSYFPNRWPDLTVYKLLILRTYRQFSGLVWLAYDQAFREHAAATKLTDWSTMNVQLYNFHSAGASVRRLTGGAVPESGTEPSGSSSSHVYCKSWNRGHCSSPFATCRYRHNCSSCSGTHRAQDCTGSSTWSKEDRRGSRSPAASSLESSKRSKR